MELNLESGEHPALVRECSGAGLRFASGLHRGPLIIHYETKVISETASLPDSIDGLDVDHFGFLREGEFEILVVGTGAVSGWLPADVSDHIQGAGIGIETAPTRQACYIFNVLLGEGRKVAALLYPPGAGSEDEK